ncbi:MAG: hypothetical protein HOE80_03335 [Candidatus Magasanikbacteria bacterium]|jgi:hypothetical protein|nr:hypothetical protein [Candidatus Magasanikbacteria bacterium]MBT4071730.1 hypothetical protein [Candidatus Magasanikbacteria bacterium]
MSKNKTIINDIVKVQEKIVGAYIENTEGTTEILKTMSDTMDKIVDKLIFLFRLLQTIVFIVTLIVWKVFLSEPFNGFLSGFIEWWPSLSEAWKIFIISIPTLILIQIIGSLIVKKIR